tara:strand:- start:749 stop:1231 length:483 start_codon:yes stop_codon:yes gene_type:complete
MTVAVTVLVTRSVILPQKSAWIVSKMPIVTVELTHARQTAQVLGNFVIKTSVKRRLVSAHSDKPVTRPPKYVKPLSPVLTAPNLTPVENVPCLVPEQLVVQVRSPIPTKTVHVSRQNGVLLVRQTQIVDLVVNVQIIKDKNSVQKTAPTLAHALMSRTSV